MAAGAGVAVVCVSVCASVRVELVCGGDDDGVASGVVLAVAVASLTVSAGAAMGSGVATGGPVTAGAAGTAVSRSIGGGLVAVASGKSGGDLSGLGNGGGGWRGVDSGVRDLVIVCSVT